MDISTQAEIVLRDGQYETWVWSGPVPITCFENASVMGFLHVFESSAALIGRWQEVQHSTLARHASIIRSAAAKAWNIYFVFLTADSDPAATRSIELIEEDFSQTRKIARGAVRAPADVERALLSLVPIRAKPVLGASHFESRLRTRLKDLNQNGLEAFLGETPADDVARILGETS
jgi:hypothetical protein